MSTEASHQQDSPHPSMSTSINDKRADAPTHARHHHDQVHLGPQDSGPQKPSARNTPMLSFQPHHTEISTDHPSVSGRLLLHIPKLHGKLFHFVSLALHLRLKESIAWTRQDLVSFEIEKQSWSQTVWDKKIMLPFQDRQVEEAGDEIYVAVIKEPSKGNKGRLEIAADEWRWEFLVPVTDIDVRPESFEGSMGAVWYELEAKCLFRWDDVDKDGHVEPGDPLSHTLESVYDVSTLNPGTSRSAALLKGLDAPTKKAKSLAQAFGKLRVGTKNKKTEHAGDFKVENQHDEFVKRSLRMRDNNMAQQGDTLEDDLNEKKTDLTPTPSRSQVQESSRAVEPLPFLIRKILKLYFVKPPPSISSSNAFFLPPPSMALPTLPGTRRLKAIIPGARIQVQIQIPSLIPIRGLAQTSQLVPDPKKGVLVFGKQSSQANDQHHHQQQQQQHLHLQQNGGGWEIDSRYLDNFQVALTVRKVTQRDIDKNDSLRKRYQTSGSSSSVSPFANVLSSTAAAKDRQLNTSMSSNNLSAQYNAGTEDGDKSKEAGGAGFSKAPSVLSDKPWRKEIRVRKVKCEFWQKETCRIPSSSNDGNVRTIKHALGPVFTYSEKDQERTRLSLQFQSQAISWDTSIAGAKSPGNEKEPSSSPLSPPLKATPSSPLQAPSVPYRTGRSGSDASLHASLHASSPAMLPTTVLSTSPAAAVPRTDASQGSRPFMLLIPVPLDSPKIRQSFTWPTSDFLHPFPGKSFDGSALARAYSGEGSDYPSSQALYQMAMMGTAADRAGGMAPGARQSLDMARSDDAIAYDSLSETSSPTSPHPTHNRPTYQYNYQSQPHQHSGSTSLRTRIEVKHYLSIRLSIDLLEFEGEVDQDEDLDLEAMEEQQLQQIRKRQELSPYGMHSGPLTLPPAAVSPRLGGTAVPFGSGVGGGEEDYPRDRSKHAINTGTSAMSSAYMNSIVASSSAAATTVGMSTMQPALTFLNSAAGLLDMDTDLDDDDGTGHRGGRRSRSNSQHQRPSRSNSGASSNNQSPQGPSPVPQSLLGSAYDLSQRRGSGASQGTVKSNSGTSPQNSAPITSGGLVVGAIGALKKKASSTGLNAVVNAVTGGTSQSPAAHAATGPGSSQPQHRRHRSSAVTVHKLKDFVIRVPITVVTQVDDLTSVGSSAKYDRGDTTTETGATDTVGSSHGSERGQANRMTAEEKSTVIGNGHTKVAVAVHDEAYDEYVEGQFMIDQD